MNLNWFESLLYGLFSGLTAMTEAAELGTKKVMEEHCSIGLVVTTDGSVTDIPRADYIDAERRAILDMRATGKPFLVIINSRFPTSPAAKALKEQLQKEFGVNAAIADCQALDTEGITHLLRELLYAFPMQELRIFLPRWMDALEADHPVKAALYDALLEIADGIDTLAHAETALAALSDVAQLQDYTLKAMDLATGAVSCSIQFPEALFYEILSNRAGMTITTDAQLLQLLTQLSETKREYD